MACGPNLPGAPRAKGAMSDEVFDDDTPPLGTPRTASAEGHVIANLALRFVQVAADLSAASVMVDELRGVARAARLAAIAHDLDVLSHLVTQAASGLREVIE